MAELALVVAAFPFFKRQPLRMSLEFPSMQPVPPELSTCHSGPNSHRQIASCWIIFASKWLVFFFPPIMRANLDLDQLAPNSKRHHEDTSTDLEVLFSPRNGPQTLAMPFF